MADYVLIVDDDYDLALTIEMILETNGYDAAIASNGREALEIVANEMPILIILDMLMPIMNGWEFAHEFLARYGHAAPILVVTAAENARARALEVAANAVLPKPFASKELIASVNALTAASHSVPTAH